LLSKRGAIRRPRDREMGWRLIQRRCALQSVE
jgi:hypothetical protein